MPTRPNRDRDAGFSVLEMLAVLTILALVASIGWAAVARPPPSDEESAAKLQAFLQDAMLATIRSGQASVLLVSADKVAGPHGELVWDPATTRVEVGAEGPVSRIVLYPDGTATVRSITVITSAAAAVVEVAATDRDAMFEALR